jgi:hypothetical protein
MLVNKKFAMYINYPFSLVPFLPRSFFGFSLSQSSHYQNWLAHNPGLLIIWVFGSCCLSWIFLKCYAPWLENLSFQWKMLHTRFVPLMFSQSESYMDSLLYLYCKMYLHVLLINPFLATNVFDVFERPLISVPFHLTWFF